MLAQASTTSIVADSLWGSTPMNTVAMHSPFLAGSTGIARRALLLRAGQSPLEPRLDTTPGGDANRKRATPTDRVGSREESIPPDAWDRVWPDTGPDEIV
jgi:hypothetical protein